MERIVGACGLTCSGCPAFLASQEDDEAKIAEIAAQWSKEYGADVKPEHVWCDGCLTAGERKCAHTGECEIRACVTDRDLANCAGCGDYGCEKMTGFSEMAPEAKKTLDEIREKS